MSHRKRLPHFIFVVSLIAFAAGNPPASDAAVSPACKPVIDAMSKQLATPSHMYVANPAESKGANSDSSELIYAGNAIYMRVHGTWSRSQMTLEQMVQQQQENIRNSKSFDCRYLRNEVVDGEEAAAYSVDSLNDDVRSSGQIWISKSRGLPLKSETNIDLGGSDKEHIATRYDYTKVQAPAGVK